MCVCTLTTPYAAFLFQIHSLNSGPCVRKRIQMTKLFVVGARTDDRAFLEFSHVRTLTVAILIPNSHCRTCSVADTNMYNECLDLTSAFVMSVMRTDRVNLLPMDLYMCMYINHPIRCIPVPNSQLTNS